MPEIEEPQRDSLACKVSGQQAKAGDLASALATIQDLPKGANREIALDCSSWTLTSQADWRIAIRDIEDLSEHKTDSPAYLFVALQLAEKGDYENALDVAKRLLGGSETTGYVHVLSQIYAVQFKAGDAPGASRTLKEALDLVEDAGRQPNTPGFDLAGRYHNLIQLAFAGGANAAFPILERLYRMEALESNPAQRQQILSHLAPSQALLGDFAGALRSADQLSPGEQRDKALLSVAAAQARQGDPAGARTLAGEISPKGWSDPSLQQFGLALAASGDYLDALSTIERLEGAQARAVALGQLALAEVDKSPVWALAAAHLAEEAAQTIPDPDSFALQLVAVVRGALGDFAGSI